MLVHIFRPPEYSPSPVSSLSSNNSTFLIFRRNGIIEFRSSSTLRPFLSFELSEEVTSSFFLDQKSVVCLAKSGNVIILNIQTLSRSTLPLNATHIATHPASHSFYFANAKNEVWLCRDGSSSSKIASVTSRITALFVTPAFVLVGTSDGWISAVGSSLTEIDVKSAPLGFASVGDGLFCVCTEGGGIHLINPISEVVLDSLPVRDSPLNAIVSIQDTVHVSGVDSRIFTAKIAGNKILKSFQGDPHLAEVLTMCVDNGRVLSGGEDCLVVVSDPGVDSYSFITLYDSSVIVGGTKNFLFISTGCSLDLFSLNSKNEDVDNNDFPDVNTNITFQIDSNVLKNLNQKITAFNHYLSLKQKNMIISCDVKSNEEYACVSTSKKAVLYSLFTGSKLHIESLKEFPPAKSVKFSMNFLILQGLDLFITILDISSFEVHKLEYRNLGERIEVTGDSILFREKGIIYDIKNRRIENGGTEIKERIEPLTDCKGTEFKSIQYSCKNGGFFTNERYLFMQKGEDKKFSTYEIGPLIHGIIEYKEDIILVQSCYKELSRSFKKGVFKKKYSNK